MKVRRITQTKDAWQYNGQPISKWPAWVQGCTQPRDDGGLFLWRKSGLQLINPGEWLIRDLDGDPEWLTDKAFRAEYEAV